MHRTLLVAACALLAAAGLRAADPTPEVKPLLTERGKLLFSDDLSQALGKEWKAGKGKWEVADGVIKASEVADDKHAAVVRHSLPFHDVAIGYSFKLDGAKATSLSINTAKNHLCRVIVRPTGLTVQKDDTDKDGPDKVVVFETRKVEIKPGEWHTLLVEIQGKEMVATLDGMETAFGSHEMLDADKANFGLTVSGESVSFKDLRVWETTPNKTWEETKKKLLEARPKSEPKKDK
jgi:Domain of Unknown Function (DUF1080)